MKKYTTYLKAFFVFSWGVCLSSFAYGSSIVINFSDGVVQHQHRADQLHPPASLTKMMTLYLVFDAVAQGKITLDDIVVISKKATLAEPCKLFLKPGEKIPLRQLVLGAIVKSANDACIAIAEHMADSEEDFAEQMTQKAKELGMHSTVFRNASGLPHPEQITTARDMARLGHALITHHKDFYPLFSTRKALIKGILYRNFNKLLHEDQGVDGIKTGYCKAAGYNLVASYVKPDGTRLIGVVLGEKTNQHRFNTMATLLGHPISERIKLGKSIIKPKAPQSGGWYVQLGVFQEKPSATSFLSKFKKRQQRLPVKGVYNTIREDGLHKVLFGPVSSRKDAERICKTLKQKGISCFPKKRTK